LEVPPHSTIPPPQASDADLEALRELLAAVGFTEERICERLGLKDIFEFQLKKPKNIEDAKIESALDVLIRLFVVSFGTDEALAERLLPAGSLDLLRRVGLLSKTRCAPAAMLYPVRGIYLASDKGMWGEDKDDPSGADLVFSAMTSHTGEYLSLMPPQPCDAFLELCGGTGVAAILAAHEGSRHAWTCDITERSTRFAEFNARLNRLTNVTALQGDLYEPVAGLTFDRIAAHPPYVPARKPLYLFRDGGADGEEIVRRVIEGVPDFLRPGGRFYLTGLVNERDGLRAEERVRRMLGESHAEFDVTLAFIRTMIPKEFCLLEVLKGRATSDEAETQEQVLQELGIERLIYCWLVVQRHATKREPFTTRRQAGPGIGWREIEWVVETESLWADAAQYQRVLESRLVPVPNVEFWVTERFSDNAWAPVSCTLRAGSPFKVEINGPQWLSDMARMCDGRSTVREILARLVEQRLIESAPPEQDFVRFLRPFATAGLFRLAAADVV